MVMTMRQPARSLERSFALVAAAVTLAIWLLLRVAIWLYIGPGELSVMQTLAAFVVGTWFDLATLAFVIAPVLLAAALLPDRWRSSRLAHLVAWIFLGAMVAVLLFGTIAEFVFWDEFSTRFN